LPAEVSNVVTQAMRQEHRGAVWQALEELSEDDRKLVLLRGIEQQPVQEIAAQLKQQPNTISVRYRRAVARLAEKVPESVFQDLKED
jgi:RNA polymerase sigma factor (sigma-70 family)